MDQADHDIIQRYLNQEMSSEERAAFDRSLQTNDDLAKLLAFEIATRKAAKANRLKEIDSMVEEYGKPKSLNQGLWKYAAMIAFLVVAGLSYYFWPSENTEILMQKKDEIALDKIIENSEDELDVAGSGMAGLLVDKKYTEAAIELRDFLDLKKTQGLNPCDYRTENLYLGSISLYHTKKYDDAVAYLRCAERNTKPDDWYYTEVGKYLTTAYIRLGAMTDARRMMEKHNLRIDDFEAWDQDRLQPSNK